MSIADELERLERLRGSGVMDDAEFAVAKAKLLSESTPMIASTSEIEKQARLWGMFLHLSLFAGYAIPLAGFIAPIVIWQIKKDELPGLDAHGKVVVNWIISHFLYLVVAAVLCLVLVGIPLLIVVSVASIAFPIIGAVKANQGEVWRYPFSISFFN